MINNTLMLCSNSLYHGDEHLLGDCEICENDCNCVEYDYYDDLTQTWEHGTW